nr:Asp-tRNA(Asn)/Glu-tRNA(Gln) amidotransferase subunit GatC [Bacillus velezensis]
MGDLGRVAIRDEEAEMITEEVDSMMWFGEEVNEVDRDKVEGRTEVVKMKKVMREDEGGKGVGVEDVMKNGRDDKEGYVGVGCIVD